MPVTGSYPYDVIVLTLSPSTIGSAPFGYLLRWSTPWNQPEKWNGMNATPLPTRSVTSALTRALEPFSGPVTQTQPPSLMPRSAASEVLTSTNMSCCNSASQRFDRVSSPPPSYSTRRPEVRMIGNCLASPLSTAAFWIEKPRLATRNWRPSGRVGYLATSSGRAV